MIAHAPRARVRRVLQALGLGALAAIAGLFASACVQANGSGPATSEGSADSARQTEEYWTPERMKEAKPAPMPHPHAAKGVTVPPRKSGSGTQEGPSNTPGEEP